MLWRKQHIFVKGFHTEMSVNTRKSTNLEDEVLPMDRRQLLDSQERKGSNSTNVGDSDSTGDSDTYEDQSCSNWKVSTLDRASTMSQGGENSSRIMSLDAEVEFLKGAVYDLGKEIRYLTAIMQSTSVKDFVCDRNLTWIIDRYSDKVASSNRSISSADFFTSRTGYKMSLKMYPYGDGCGQGDHMSIFFTIVKGPFDDLLKWPFTGSVTIRLLNQSGRGNQVMLFTSNSSDSKNSSPSR